MLGTLSWRMKEALSVLTGKKKTFSEKSAVSQPEKSLEHLEEYIIQDKELAEYINSVSIEFCFSEFGENRVNAGGNEFKGNRLDPSLSTLKRFFPNAKYTVYSDFDLEIPGVNLKKIITSPIKDEEHPRHFYRVADYFKFKSLLDSEADFKCVIDTDMFAVSEEIYRLVFLTQTFGACAPYNTRNLLKRDMEISKDTKAITDLSNGFGHSYNQSPMTLRKDFEPGKKFYEACCKWMIHEPSRASRVMWNAAKETGFSPYLLPAEFCVCEGDIGVGNEVMLHVGHPKVAEYYNVKM
ncbi:MAG: hypothetical protein QM564_10815 [Bergeyella sp.]